MEKNRQSNHKSYNPPLSERVGDYSVMPDEEFFHLDHGENKSHLNDNNL